MDDRLIRLIASCVMGFPGKDLPEILCLELLMYLMCRYQQSIRWAFIGFFIIRKLVLCCNSFMPHSLVHLPHVLISLHVLIYSLCECCLGK